MPPPPVVYVSTQTLQHIFNQERYWERAQAGELQQIVFWRGRTTPSHEPPGTESQMVRYIDPTTNEEVAQVHQYLRPDGSLGASGRPDPKRLLHDNALYLPYPQSK